MSPLKYFVTEVTSSLDCISSTVEQMLLNDHLNIIGSELLQAAVCLYDSTMLLLFQSAPPAPSLLHLLMLLTLANNNFANAS